MNKFAAELENGDLLESLGLLPEQEAAALERTSLAPAEPTETLETPSNTYSPGVTSSVEEKALTLLGSGVPAESVASALGVVPARIAQLLSNKLFADKVAELRYKSLQQHNRRDGKYDSMEDILLAKLEKSLPLMVKPDTILKAINTVNGATRRGQSAPDQVVNQQNLVQIIMPAVISRKFTIDINNSVTKAGDQELHTMPSGNLLTQVEDAEKDRQERIQDRVGKLLDHQTTEDQTQELPADRAGETVNVPEKRTGTKS